MKGPGPLPSRLPLIRSSTMRSTATTVTEQLLAIRDALCHANAANISKDVRFASGYGAGVEAMWEAAEDAVKAFGGRIDPHGPTDDEAT